MIIRLELVHKKAKVKKVLLKADTIIGRSTECGLRIASDEVSRQHCKICLGEDGVTVRDLGSSNGTFVNGYQLEPDTDYEIAPDSELSLGGIKFLVRFSESPTKVMQTDALGSTVDLKPDLHPVGEETNDGGGPGESSEEAMHFAEADERTEPEPGEPLPTSETGTVQMTRPRELDSVMNEPDFELSTHGDSAILEREDAANLSDSVPALPITDEERVADSEPEDEFEDEESEAQHEEKAPESAEREQPEESQENSPEEPNEDNVAAFLDQVADQDEEDIGEDESLGDFFKQLGDD